MKGKFLLNRTAAPKAWSTAQKWLTKPVKVARGIPQIIRKNSNYLPLKTCILILASLFICTDNIPKHVPFDVRCNQRRWRLEKLKTLPRAPLTMARCSVAFGSEGHVPPGAKMMRMKITYIYYTFKWGLKLSINFSLHLMHHFYVIYLN